MMRAVAAMSLLATACLALPGNQVQNQLKDEGDFVHRPLKWSGLERPDARVMLKDLSTKATHQHGAVQPFVATSSEKMAGYDTYRVYLLFDDSIGQSMYAIYGDEYSELSFHTDDGTPFFNEADPFGTNTGGVHPAMYEVKPNSQFDSWLTINQDDGENKEKINSIGIEWDEFNAGGALKTSDGAVFLMNPEDIPDFTGELPPEITDKTKRAVLLAQLTVTTGSTFSGHVNVQGKQKDGEPWQEHGVCFSIGKGCAKHPRPVHDET